MTPSLFLGLAVALCGALLLASGSELQSRAVYRAGGRWRAFLTSPRWLLGLIVLALAISLNFVALGLAPVAAVQSMGVAALAASATLGSLTRRIIMTRAGIISLLLCALGITGFIATLVTHPAEIAALPASHKQFPVEGQLLLRAQLTMVTQILGALTLLGIGAVLLGKGTPRSGVRVLGLVLAGVVFGSITTVFKAIVTLVMAEGLVAAITDPLTLQGLGTVAVGGVAGNLLLQRSHLFFPAPAVLAALTIVDPITAAVIGISVLGEATLTASACVTLVVCGLIACIGVAGVTRLKRAPSREAGSEHFPDHSVRR